MKILVITQGNNSVYGAATSLKYLLRNCDWEYDLIYTRYLKKKFLVTEQDMRGYCNQKVKHVYRLFLPFEANAISSKRSLYKKARYFVYKILIFFDGIKLKKIIEMGNYDYILLNSIVLYPMISQKHRYVCYIREACTAEGRVLDRIIEKLNEADKLIFIDPSLQAYLPGVKTKSMVINNPFDMRSVADVTEKEVSKQFPELDLTKIIVSVIGQIQEIKGVLFAIDAFCKLERKDMLLLIAGKGGDEEYLKKCLEAAKGNDSIIFIGELSDMQPIYRVCDYVLRADEFFCTGRTVYEGLYSGCGVIIQGNEYEDSRNFQEYDRFSDRIYFYEAREETSLISVLETLPEQKITDRCYEENVDSYVKSVTSFLRE